jgi:hypothetical protein
VFISLFLSPGGEAAEFKTERNLIQWFVKFLPAAFGGKKLLWSEVLFF